jgi:two-component system LytT family response regulator
MKFKAIVIDDEQNAVVNIELILKEFCPDIELVGSATSPVEGLKLINELNPDILFLDIEMPGMNGFELLNSLPNRNFDVIFVTAYNQYAIEAFKVNAIDYILKPVNIQDLIASVNKLVNSRKANESQDSKIEQLLQSMTGKQKTKLPIAGLEGIEYIDMDEIIHIEADGGYSDIYLEDRKITTSKNLKEIQNKLDMTKFFRTHNSHIVNLEHVKKFSTREQYAEMSNGSQVPVSRRSKDEFLQTMSKYFS